MRQKIRERIQFCVECFSALFDQIQFGLFIIFDSITETKK